MSKAALLCSAVLIVSLADGATAQPQTQGTAIPNLSSANFGWQHGLGFGLQPVEGKIAPTKLAPVVPGVERLADDQNPNLTPWAAAQMRMHNDLVKNGHRAFSAQSRCWPGGTPAQLAFLQPFYFIQTPNVVWMIWERDHQVPAFTSTASTAKIRSRLGSGNRSAITRTASLSSIPSASSSIP